MSTKELVREMKRTQQKMTRLQNGLAHQVSTDHTSLRRRASVIRATAGQLKRKIKANPLAWQRKERERWER